MVLINSIEDWTMPVLGFARGAGADAAACSTGPLSVPGDTVATLDPVASGVDVISDLVILLGSYRALLLYVVQLTHTLATEHKEQLRDDQHRR